MVSFFSGSWPLTLKSSIKSLQTTTFLIQNEYWENNELVLVKTSSFWVTQVVIWQLFDYNLRQEIKSQRKKELHANAAIIVLTQILWFAFFQLSDLAHNLTYISIAQACCEWYLSVEWHNRRIYGTWDCKSTITDSNHQTCIRVVRPTPLHTPGMPTSACNCMTIVPVPEMTGTNTRIWQCAKVQNSNKDFWTASWPFHSRAIPFEIIWVLDAMKLGKTVWL